MLARVGKADRETWDYVETLEEEIRQLKAKIDDLTGMGFYQEAIRVFGLTPTEAKIFCLLVKVGAAEYPRMESLVFDDDRHLELDNPIGAIRTYIKRMRQKIRPHGLDCETVYGFGFNMSEEMRAAAKRLLAERREQGDV